MICPTCEQETTIDHEVGMLVYLTCKHKACRNPHPGLHASWRGLRDGAFITFDDIADMELVPAGDMSQGDIW